MEKPKRMFERMDGKETVVLSALLFDDELNKKKAVNKFNLPIHNVRPNKCHSVSKLIKMNLVEVVSNDDDDGDVIDEESNVLIAGFKNGDSRRTFRLIFLFILIKICFL